MTIKWCTFTGALMLLAVLCTHMQQSVTSDPPGVTSRWWDGTRASEVKYYKNGQMSARTIYGDDGHSVLSSMRWNPAGAVTYSLIRQKDGTVEEKAFSYDGKVLLRYRLYNGDMQSTRVVREYSDDTGKIVQERIWTPDGKQMIESREWDRLGRLSFESRIMDNKWADNVTDYYQDGKLSRRTILRGTGEQFEIRFGSNGKMSTRTMYNGFTDDASEETFDGNEQLLYSRESFGRQPGLAFYRIYENGKLKYKQTFKSGELQNVEEYTPGSPELVRTIYVDANRRVVAVHRFRSDGTLSVVKTIKDGNVVKQQRYDSTGKTVVSTDASGEPEVIDPDATAGAASASTRRRGTDR
jgi:antitoxin component YwqK of YwqJK toxin-antitoxin module